MKSSEEDVENKAALVSLAICKALLDSVRLDSMSNCELLDSKFQTIKNLPKFCYVKYDSLLSYHIEKGWMTQNVFTALVDLIDAQYLLALKQHDKN